MLHYFHHTFHPPYPILPDFFLIDNIKQSSLNTKTKKGGINPITLIDYGLRDPKAGVSTLSAQINYSPDNKTVS
jgi:hypothetical protein